MRIIVAVILLHELEKPLTDQQRYMLQDEYDMHYHECPGKDTGLHGRSPGLCLVGVYTISDHLTREDYRWDQLNRFLLTEKIPCQSRDVKIDL